MKIILKNTIWIVLISILGFGVPSLSFAEHINFPLTSNIYMHAERLQDPDNLARYDIVIMPMESVYYFPTLHDELRKRNPNIKLLAYIPSQSFNTTWNDPMHNIMKNSIQQNWWLKDQNGNQVYNWDTIKMLNVSTGWSTYLADFVSTNILSSRYWDGVFYDMVDDTITWLNDGNIDVNNDGVRDDAHQADQAWLWGMKNLLQRTREQNPDTLIVINGSSHEQLRSYINGRMFENFPTPWHGDGSWVSSTKSYFDAHNQLGFAPYLFIINSNSPLADNYQKMRFGLTSSLMGNGYFGFDYGPSDHGQLWWYDEYDANLGAPINGPLDVNDARTEFSDDIWMREFEKGLVVVNASEAAKKITLNQEYEKLHGIQDPVHNDGSIISELYLKPHDGIILHKRIEEILGATYSNGAFVRIFDKNGNVTRSGFFSYKRQYQPGSKVLIKDINEDGYLETVVANKNKIYIYSNTGILLTSFYPYTFRYINDLNFTIADLNNDGTQEIITGTMLGGGAHVRTFDINGRPLSPGFFAYDKVFRGGVSVAVGDVNGDGYKEIITGAGVGGGPHIRIFSFDGRLVNPGFFAYEKSFRGGVRVASGDVNGDGIDEIITAPGPSGGPHIKIFNNKGYNVAGDFFAFSADNTSGIQISVFDIDGDGIDDIVAQTEDFFEL